MHCVPFLLPAIHSVSDQIYTPGHTTKFSNMLDIYLWDTYAHTANARRCAISLLYEHYTWYIYYYDSVGSFFTVLMSCSSSGVKGHVAASRSIGLS